MLSGREIASSSPLNPLSFSPFFPPLSLSRVLSKNAFFRVHLVFTGCRCDVRVCGGIANLCSSSCPRAKQRLLSYFSRFHARLLDLIVSLYKSADLGLSGFEALMYTKYYEQTAQTSSGSHFLRREQWWQSSAEGKHTVQSLESKNSIAGQSSQRGMRT